MTDRIYKKSYKGFDIYFNEMRNYTFYHIYKNKNLIKEYLTSERACKLYITKLLKKEEE